MPDASRKRNCPDGFSGFTPELGAGPLEVTVGFHDGNAIFGYGISYGVGGKATLCYYKIIDKNIINANSCGNCDINKYWEADIKG